MARDTPERRRLLRGGVPDCTGSDDIFLPYTPAPLPELPLAAPLPTGWYDDPGYRLLPYAFAGCADRPDQFGVFGTTLRKGEQVATSYAAPFAHGYFGPPGSGKTYIEGVHIEAALQRNRYQSHLVSPLCAVSVSYGRHGGGGHGAEQLAARLPNQDPREVAALLRGHGTLPEGICDVVCLTPRRNVAALRAQHPHCQVLGLAFSCGELGITGLQALMAMDERADSLLAAEIAAMVAALPRGLALAELLAAVEEYPFREGRLRHLVRRRVELAGELIDDRASLRGLLRPGRLIVVDLRDDRLPPARAMTVLRVLLSVLVLGEGPLPCGLLLCLDEAHKLLGHRDLRLQIEHIIRERRHLGTSVLLLSQDPAEVPHSTLAELDAVGLFSTGSERSIRHLARDIETFRHARAEDAMALSPGQMLFWSKRWHTPYAPGEFDGKLLRIEARPRLSHHGGATRVASL